MEEVSVRSSGGASITLSEFERPYGNGYCRFRMRLEDQGLSASVVVDDHISLSVEPHPALGDRTGTLGLTHLVAETARDYAGWDEEKRWGSLEGTVSVSVVFESGGYGVFTVDLQMGWHAVAMVRLDTMQRERWARELDSFFRHKDFGRRAV